jgi:hypothetical protein
VGVSKILTWWNLGEAKSAKVVMVQRVAKRRWGAESLASLNWGEKQGQMHRFGGESQARVSDEVHCERLRVQRPLRANRHSKRASSEGKMMAKASLTYLGESLCENKEMR